MSTTDESMNATTDEADNSWETTKSVLTATINKVNISDSAQGSVGNSNFTVNSNSNDSMNNSNNQPEGLFSVAASSTLIKTVVFPAASANGGDKPYKCDTCEKAFSLRRALKAHKRVHTGEKPFKCDTCPKAFSHQGALKAHKRVHTGERPFKCDVCDMSFSHRSTLITHRRTHTGEKPFKCDLCDEVFSYRQTMKSHRKKHFLAANANGLGATNATAHTIVKRMRCDTCGLEFASKEEVETHIIEVHVEKKIFNCLTCKKNFPTSYSLEKHKLMHLVTNSSSCSIPFLKCNVIEYSCNLINISSAMF
ncbi:zinc finger and SCAN domain-containing 2-like [Octopus vulgaris]|uniref:Zinc finger and SCAN domain-containing 2-like n=1 Tax=Octopus vulgaris TaxID=6645 RepID=A0AA36BGS4_OCTVU|nr:zinc finger and SCAN domain-containing 2-like [Octopus vulgaris]